MGAEDTGRITISEDKLYRALGDLELRLVEKLATKEEAAELRKVVEKLATKDEVADLRKERDTDRLEIESLKRWRAYVTGMSTTALALASACVAIVLWSLTHPH